MCRKQGGPEAHAKQLCDPGPSGILEGRHRIHRWGPSMYENTIFEPIYGHSDLGSIAVAIFIVAVCVGTSLALGHVANMIGNDKT